MLVFLDFESFYSKEYSLRRLPTCSYVRNPLFQATGCGIFIPSVSDKVIYAEGPEQVKKLLDGLPWHKIHLVCHNMKFDGFVLAAQYGYVPKRYIDTMDMAKALLGTSIKSVSLDALAEHFGLGSKVHGALLSVSGKRFEDYTLQDRIDMKKYGIQDVNLLFMIYHALLGLGAGVYTESGLTQEDMVMDMTHRMFCEPVFELDHGLLEQLHEKEVRTLEEIVEKTGQTKTALRSGNSFGQMLRELGVEVQMKQSLSKGAIQKQKATGETTLTPALAKNDDFFLSLLEHHDPQVQLLAQARQAVNSNITRTRARSYADVSGEGPWPVDLSYSGARVTHRFSGSGGGGGNPQNLGRGSPLRDSILAPEGKVVVVADLSAIELRTSAEIAGQDDLLMTVRANDIDPDNTRDAYVTFAEDHIFRRRLADKYDYPVDYKIERTTGKVAILSCGYRSGGATFRGMLRAMSGGQICVDLNRAEELVRIYRNAHPKYVETWEWMDNVVLARMANPAAQPEGREQLRPNVPLWVDYKNQRVYGQSGLAVKYPNLRREMHFNPFLGKDTMQYVYDDYTKGGVAFIHGGKMLGNLSSFAAREVIMYQSCIVNQTYPVKLSVHDENAALVWEHQGQECLDYMLRVMKTPLPWWPTLPLNAEGDIGSCYGDAK